MDIVWVLLSWFDVYGVLVFVCKLFDVLSGLLL